MKFVRSGLVLTFLLAVTAVGCDSTPTQSAAPAATPTKSVYDWLVAEAVPVAAPLRVDVAGLPTQDPTDPRQVVGVTATLGARVSLADVAAADLAGATRATPVAAAGGAVRADGDGFVWSAVVEADSAWAVRLELTEFDLPAGAELYLYSDNGEVAGPYTAHGPDGDGAFWAHTLRGSQIGLQLRYAGADAAGALAASRFAIADVGVLDDRFAYARFNTSFIDKAFCSFNAGCVNNASCSNVPAAVQAARSAVALMLFTSGGFQYICSGGLVADSVNSGTPYFLTANHCISRSREADSLQTFFQFSTACNSPNCAFPGSGDVDTTGATILASNRTGDFTLLQLAGNPPAGSAFLPVNNTPIASSNNAQLFRISHPGGAPQAYSEHRVDTSAGTCSSWPRGSWIYSRDTSGATEGGSSGSPVLNAAGEVVGQLSGACGTNVNDNCDAQNNATVDGALASYWDQVAPFLAPSGCTGGAEVCDDGIDNDCDGQIDGADSDCAGGTCEPVGASCSSNADCCSNKCKGPSGGQTCR